VAWPAAPAVMAVYHLITAQGGIWAAHLAQ
jgi:hypothetical protein